MTPMLDPRASELEVYKAMITREIMLNQATSAFEHAVLAPLLLLNGGASVAFLTLLGSGTDEKSKLSLALGWGVAATAMWAAGLIAAAVAASFGFRAQRALSRAHRIRRQRVEFELLAQSPALRAHLLPSAPGEDPVLERQRGRAYGSVFEAIQSISIACFVLGCVFAALSILTI